MLKRLRLLFLTVSPTYLRDNFLWLCSFSVDGCLLGRALLGRRSVQLPRIGTFVFQEQVHRGLPWLLDAFLFTKTQATLISGAVDALSRTVRGAFLENVSKKVSTLADLLPVVVDGDLVGRVHEGLVVTFVAVIVVDFCLVRPGTRPGSFSMTRGAGVRPAHSTHSTVVEVVLYTSPRSSACQFWKCSLINVEKKWCEHFEPARFSFFNVSRWSVLADMRRSRVSMGPKANFSSLNS